MSDKVELLPCPFCGNPARLESNRDWHRIVVDHDERCAFLEPESVMVPATDDQLSMAITCWNRRTDLAQQPAPAVLEDLRARCAEILAWQKTGVLKGDALRGYARAQWYADEHNSLQMAEADTARQAYAMLSAAPAAPIQADHTALLAELYQILGEHDASEKALEQVQAAIAGEPLPHASLLPYEVPAAQEPAEVYAVRYLSNWDGEGDDVYVLAWKRNGELVTHEGGVKISDLLEYQGDKILNVWPLYTAPPAAEQPDTVKVPRELLACAARSCANGWVDYPTAKELRALLGKESEDHE